MSVVATAWSVPSNICAFSEDAEPLYFVLKELLLQYKASIQTHEVTKEQVDQLLISRNHGIAFK